MAQISESKRFSSWKEIAAYMRCDIRTCHRWERNLGLPVRRMETGPRSRVFAYQEEIDKWMKSRPGNGDGIRAKSQASIRSLLFLYSIISAAVITAAALFVNSMLLKAKLPADFRIQGSVLHVLDEKGKEVFRYDSRLENLAFESEYKNHSQIRRTGWPDWRTVLPYIIIKDIDDDHRPEVLFSTQTQDEFNEGELICLDSRGRPKWRVKTGRETTFGKVTYAADYRISGFDTLDLDGDGSLEILCLSVHRPNFPCQLLALSNKGKILGEYWNSGHMMDFLLTEGDGGISRRLIVVGTNNEYRGGCLIAFDPADIRGSSPQSEERYLSKVLEPGSEKIYVILPPTDLEISEAKLASLVAVSRHPNGTISAVGNYTGLIYRFYGDFSKHEILSSSQFEQLHAKSRREGIVRGELTSEYFEALNRRILYWTGSSWTTAPTMIGAAVKPRM